MLPMTARWKTLSTYRSQMRLHVVPALGAWRMSEIQPEHLEAHYRRMQTDGHSAHTIRAVHRVLRSALNEAVRRRRLAGNPALISRPPRVEDVEVEPLSIEESRRVLQAAQSTLQPARWSIALSLGMRQGEALGLLWEDVDLDEGVVRVRRSVQRHNWEHGCEVVEGQPSCGRKRGAECDYRTGGGLLLVEPKTKASKRTIVLPAPLVEELRVHRVPVNRRRLAAGEKWDVSYDLVFPAASGGLIDPSRDHTEWKSLLKKSGLRDVRLHDAATPQRPSCLSRESTSAPSCRSWAGPRWPPPSATPTPSTSSAVGRRARWERCCGTSRPAANRCDRPRGPNSRCPRGSPGGATAD
ncbi:tyrosine-type recombinase/integrase [Nocardioides antri]|uniref:Tyrosine-type recombinase/integrase n=1 Tax=Nocardioides antri TaxID=2607659 RepID=A0A5B1M4V4_9ACTN|nr:tyrosine-type recombinase/integrase [Nocardioides antri]